MSRDILAEIGLSLIQVSELNSSERSRLLHFLLRWEHIAALHDCLDILIPRHPTLVSLLDLRVKALQAQARLDEAQALMRQRLQRKSSLTAQALLAQLHLEKTEEEEVATAYDIARRLTQERPETITAWRSLAQVEVARGKTEAALKAYQKIHALSSSNRSYLLGMMHVYQACGDLVTASGYAVRLLRTAEAGTPLPVRYLRQLRAYFQASGEATRVTDMEAVLQQRYAEDLAKMQAHFGEATSSAPMAAPQRASQPAPEKFLPTYDQVPVTEQERQRITEAAHRFFGFTELLPGQVETMACVLREEDVLTILPTGGGKSLCYQLPAMLAKTGATLVVSPLIALMKDQIDSLPDDLRARAATINSSLSGDELRHRLEQAQNGAYRLIYAAPERLRQPVFLHTMRCAGLNYLVVDEAHCVSAWGHDFRPDYLALGQAREALGHPPLLAMTATAPPRVRQDIIQHLNGKDSSDVRIVAGDVTRPNLQLEVFHARDLDAKLRRLIAFCRATEGSGIVYAGTRARCERLAALLRRYGVDATHYHAGIHNRHAVQDAFMTGRVRVVVATIAFGLGIDKPDIRFIVHFMPPASLEAYYQEAGRAGRDGLPARCLLMYAATDRGTLTRRTNRDTLPVEFLRQTYAAVQGRVGAEGWGRVALGDLERDLRTDNDVRIRVALSLLEEAALLHRGPDVPRAAQLCLANADEEAMAAHDARLLAFCRAARLRPEQWLTVDLAEGAREAQLSLETLESQILTWADAGWLSHRFSGRDLYLALLPPPKDAAARVAALLERYETIQAQHVDEITAYARTIRCRHGYLNAYLGGRTIEKCTACDNCIETSRATVDDLPDTRAQLLAILQCLAATQWGWGRRNLSRILRGDDDAPGRARRHETFGALAFRSATAIRHLVERLEHADLISAHSLDHGGVVLHLTDKGRTALQDPAPLDALIPTASEPSEDKDQAADTEGDPVLFEALRVWRAREARDQEVPPYVVFHDSHLRIIANQRPQTLDALEAIKGVGPKRLEKYGQALIALICKFYED